MSSDYILASHDYIDAYMDILRWWMNYENFKSFILYFLVCTPNTSHVSHFSISCRKILILGGTSALLHIYYYYFYPIRTYFETILNKSSSIILILFLCLILTITTTIVTTATITIHTEYQIFLQHFLLL